MAPGTIAEEITFAKLCEVFESIAMARRGSVRTKVVKKFIDMWRQRHLEKYGSYDTTDDSFFPALRLLLPSFDRERGVFGFKEHFLAKRLIEVLVMDKNGVDAQRLLNFRSPAYAKDKQNLTGDFATLASFILEHRIGKGNRLTVAQINACLDDMAAAYESKNSEAMKKHLEYLCRNLGQTEMKWLIRILLHQLKLGVSGYGVFALFHPDAAELYDVSMSLRRVCEQLHDPRSHLDSIQVELFTPFRPMLASLTQPSDVPTAMHGDDFFVETKFDGERTQLHRSGNDYRYFSRSGNDLTSVYGGGPYQGTLTKKIRTAFSDDVTSCILDGEMVGWNEEASCFVTKSGNFDVKALKDGDVIHPCFVAFDIVLLNGRVLTGDALLERHQQLKNVIHEIGGWLMIAEQKLANSEEHVIRELTNAIERREEGIIIKHPESTYRMNIRSSTAGWLKIKPDYVEGLCDDLDMIIVGGYFGSGKWSNLLSHFMVAVIEKQLQDEGGERRVYKSVCKVGSGYTMKELYDLNLHLISTPMKRGKPPKWLVLGSEKADVYIEPENSKIVQVRATEVVSSSAFGIGYTLRFPRVMSVRDDKTWTDCMTVNEFLSLKEVCAGKLARQTIEAAAKGGSSARRSPRRRSATKQRAQLGRQFESAALESLNAEKRTTIFSGLELYVVNGSAHFPKKMLEKMVVENGGSFVQHPTAKTYCVVAEKMVVQVQSIVDSGLYNVVKAEWLINCCQQSRLLPWRPHLMWFATPATSLQFKAEFDEFGDSFFEPVSLKELKAILASLQPVNLCHENVVQLITELLPSYKFSLFCGLRVYVDMYRTVNKSVSKIAHSPLELVELKLKLYGATIVDAIDRATSHVIVSSNDLCRIEKIESLRIRAHLNFAVVTDEWVTDSIDSMALRDVSIYCPVA